MEVHIMKASATSSVVIVMLLAAGIGMAQEGRRASGRAALETLSLDYEIRGSGEPVVLVHAGIFADWFKPLLDEASLTDRYRVVSYHRVGYAGSSHVAGAVSLADQAAHLRALMRQLGIDRAHLVGHSSGGNIALQLALDAPHMVHSLVLMEPALSVPTAGTEGMLSRRTAMTPAFEAFRAGDRAAAVDHFMRVVSGPGYRVVLDRVLPDAFTQAAADADTFFGQELPAVLQWSFKREDAARIGQPTLSVVGAKSLQLSPIWKARHELILAWFPKAEGFVLEDATHLLHVERPRATAEALAAFFARVK
jgi:pimeloyl-ACP methyl ester carboxylesterase